MNGLTARSRCLPLGLLACESIFFTEAIVIKMLIHIDV